MCTNNVWDMCLDLTKTVLLYIDECTAVSAQPNELQICTDNVLINLCEDSAVHPTQCRR